MTVAEVPLGDRSEVQCASAAFPGRSDGLLGGGVESVALKAARAEGRAGHPGARPQERALGIGSRAASAHQSSVTVVLILSASATFAPPSGPSWLSVRLRGRRKGGSPGGAMSECFFTLRCRW